MMHRNRTWNAPTDVTLEEFAAKVAGDGMTWCGCQSWRIGEYVFVNDATSPGRGVLRPVGIVGLARAGRAAVRGSQQLLPLRVAVWVAPYGAPP